MAFCLPPKNASEFVKALQDGRIDPDKMRAMSSEDRRAFFAKIIGPENAHEVNAAFESKLLLKDWQRGLVSWAKSVGGLKDPVRRDFIDRINRVERVLNPDEEDAFLSDLAAKKVGIEVTRSEAKTISDLARKAQEARDAPTENMSGVSDDALSAASDLRAYIASLKPTTALKSIGKNLAVIGRNNLLANPATPIKTTVGQTVNSAMDYFTRRIGAVSTGGYNADLVARANKEAWNTFRKTGMNVASMESLDDTGKLGEGHRFDVNAGVDRANPALRSVETGIRKVAQVSNKIIIDWAHNIPFTKFYQKAFYDMANVLSSGLARSEGHAGDAARGRAAEIFKDAARVKPETREGAIVRLEAQKQGARVTSTNDTFTGRLALGVKDALNRSFPGLGDALMPIAKIPANIIWNGIENAGIGLPMGAKDIFEGRAKMQADDLATKQDGFAQFSFGIQRVARVVGALAAAAYFSSLLQKRDFRQDQYGQNFVRIGNTWINLEYVSAISPALAGMMEVRAKGNRHDSVLGTASQYAAGAAASLKNAPGIDELSQLVEKVSNVNFARGMGKYASDFFTSRGVPAFIPNLMRDRPVNRLLFGAHGIETEGEVRKDAADTRAALRKSRHQ